MKYLPIFLFLSTILLSFQTADEYRIDEVEAKKAFALLNEIRTNHEKYIKEYKLASGLKVTKSKLQWNDTLAKVAQEKAKDMAKRKYVKHVDPSGYAMNHYINKAGYKLNKAWIKNKEENYFESIAAGYHNAEDIIKTLLIDEGTPNMGHRDHLLGIGTWNASLYDVGIGIVRINGGYNTYVSIIIAKHDW